MKNTPIYLLLAVLSACTTAKIHYQKEDKDWKTIQQERDASLLYSLYLVGDAGDEPKLSQPVMDGLKSKLDSSDAQSSGVIFLGDNIYPEGLHKKGSKHRTQDESRINVQLDAVKAFKGDVVFIPGNHDWDRHGKGGLKHVKRQEEYIQKYLDKGNVFLPSHGCPGPETVKLAPGLVLIIIDTQWWLHQFERASGEKDGCDVRTPDELMVLFKDLLKKYRNQNVIVAGHHPLYSNGYHGGHFTLKDHLFPLATEKKNIYIPFPIIGSIYPFYRKFFGHAQDIAHPVYQDMKNKLVKAMNEYENVIYVAGHEHNLQYKKERSVHHIVSGSGSKVTHLQMNKRLAFGAMRKGYSKIAYYDNGQMWLEFFVLDETTGKETLGYRKLLFSKEVVKNEPVVSNTKISYKNKFMDVVPDSNFAASGLKRLFFGDLNRKLWTTPLKVPYLDIHFEKGGLTPIKKGGGMQTLSLRMKGGNGKQYTLRGIKKNPTFLTEKNLRGTIAQDLIYDGMAGSHPYASVVIPKLSEAAGVYHANPTLVYVPKDSILGDYLEEFGGMFCLFEERPDGDMSEDNHFGNSKRVMNYKDAIHKIHLHSNHMVDIDYTLNARLFDIVIGDWDRHDDQWRWASFKQDGKTWYRPIPRDRDQAFFEFDGILMSLVNRKWMIRKFQPFDDDIRDMAGQNFNARYFDRSFLIEASREDWIRIAKRLQQNLSDDVIESAIREFPIAGFEITGEEIIATLRRRRDKLVEFAEEYYEILAKEVSIPGTLKDDFFEIIRQDDGSVEVNIYPRKKGHKKKKERFYHRVFDKKETKEIRIYGLEGNDEFKVKGKTKKSIMVRIVAGFHKDRIEDRSKVSGPRKLTKVYETDGKNEFDIGKETRLKEMEEEQAYDYDRKDFIYNKLSPTVSIGSNPNDGFFIGPGFRYVTHGFKKSPYKYSHQLVTNYAFGANGYHLYYEYDYIDVLGKADLAGKLKVNTPLVYSYYGSGNERQVLNDNIELYNVRMNDYEFIPSLKFASKSHSQILNVGINLQRVNFDATPTVAIESWELEQQDFVGASINYLFQNKDDKLNPSRGIMFKANVVWNNSINSGLVNYFNLGSELSLYLPLNFIRKQTTVNLRSGFETNIGDYTFFQANFLSGFKNFRGIQRNRYSGKTSNYYNAELRTSLFKVRNYVAPFDVGLMVHTDLARVWEEQEISKKWHSSYGGGAFINILDYLMLMGTYSISETDSLLTIGSQFFF